MNAAAPFPEPQTWPQGSDTGAEKVLQGQVDLVVANARAVLDRDTEESKARRDAALAAEAAQRDTGNKLQITNREAELANLEKFSETVAALSVGAIERNRVGADQVLKASAAVVTLYTGVLALVFSVTDNPLPLRGVVAPVFLGLAVVLATAYSAYVAPNVSNEGASYIVSASGNVSKTLAHLNVIAKLASHTASKRAYVLRASVISLGFGLASIVLPFVALPSGTAPAKAAWPTPQASIPDKLNAILYKAQVDEVVAARAATAPAGDDATLVVIAVLLGLLLVFLMPLIRLPKETQLPAAA